jgi:hypothetical protein
MGLPATPHFKDLDNKAVYYGSELYFLKIIVLPLFEVTNKFLAEELHEEMGHLSGNIRRIEQLLLQEKEKSPTLH